MEYAKRQKLAGVMVWSVDTDDFRGKCASLHGDMTLLDGRDYPLMKAINTVLANNTIPFEGNQLPNSSFVQLLSNIAFVLSIAMIYLSL